MKLIFSEQAWDDDLCWQSHDPKLIVRLNGLIKERSRGGGPAASARSIALFTGQATMGC